MAFSDWLEKRASLKNFQEGVPLHHCHLYNDFGSQEPLMAPLYTEHIYKKKQQLPTLPLKNLNGFTSDNY